MIWPRGKPEARPRGQGGEDEHREPGVVRGRRALGGRAGRAAGRRSRAAARRRCRPRYGVFEPPQGRYDPAAPGRLHGARARRLRVLVRLAPVLRRAHVPARAQRQRADRPRRRLARARGRPALARDRRRPVRSRGRGARRLLRGGLGGAGLARCRATTASGSLPAGRRAGPRSAATAGRACRPSRRGSRWFGGGYREPVAAALATAAPRRRLLRRAIAPTVDARPEGCSVRLGEPPRAKLPRLPLPPELLRPG